MRQTKKKEENWTMGQIKDGQMWCGRVKYFDSSNVSTVKRLTLSSSCHYPSFRHYPIRTMNVLFKIFVVFFLPLFLCLQWYTTCRKSLYQLYFPRPLPPLLISLLSPSHTVLSVRIWMLLPLPEGQCPS